MAKVNLRDTLENKDFSSNQTSLSFLWKKFTATMLRSTSTLSSSQNKRESIQKLITNQKALLCNIPVIIVVLVAALDNADKQLLAASFPMLEKELHLDVQTLGYFSLFTNLSYAMSLPFWGYLVHKYGMENIHIVLSFACASWGMATIGIAVSGSSVLFQGIFRALNGIALGSILPLSQTLLVELVPSNMKGRAFGFMKISERLAGTIGAASIIYLDTWQTSYYCLGFFSVSMAWIAYIQLHPTKRRKYKNEASSFDAEYSNIEDPNDPLKTSNDAPTLTLCQIVVRIWKIPAFIYLVLQGMFGGTPWDMMSFTLLLLDWRGFTKEQIVTIQFTSGISAMIGGWVGGTLGDYAQQRFGTIGRIGVAIICVIGRLPYYGLFLYATNFYEALIWNNIFYMSADWTQPAAIRPICADLAHNPSERAQIISMWMLLEKTSGAIFGAPLVGYLTSKMLSEIEMKETETLSVDKAQILAYNLFALSSLFWGITACFWTLMGCSTKNTNIKSITNTPTESSIINSNTIIKTSTRRNRNNSRSIQEQDKESLLSSFS